MRRRKEDKDNPNKGQTIYIKGENLTEDIVRRATGKFGKVIDITIPGQKK